MTFINRITYFLLVFFSLLFFLAAVGWYAYCPHYFPRVPDGYFQEIEFDGQARFYDGKSGNFSESKKIKAVQNTEIKEKKKNILEMANIFEIRDDQGRDIFRVEKDFFVDQKSGAVKNGNDGTKKEGEFFVSRNTGKNEDLVIWLANYDADVRMRFIGIEKIEELTVYHYRYQPDAFSKKIEAADFIRNAEGLPDIEEAAIESRIDLWIEPITGYLADMKEESSVYSYKKASGEKTTPILEFTLSIEEERAEKIIKEIGSARKQYSIFSIIIPVSLILCSFFFYSLQIFKLKWSLIFLFFSSLVIFSAAANYLK